MKRRLLFTGAMAIAGALVLAQSPIVRAAVQVPAPAAEAAHDAHHPATAAPAPAPETQAMAMHQRMMDEMKAMDAKMDSLVAKMNAAKGDAKMEAMAVVVTALAQQRAMMRDGSMKMECPMMKMTSMDSTK